MATKLLPHMSHFDRSNFQINKNQLFMLPLQENRSLISDDILLSRMTFSDDMHAVIANTFLLLLFSSNDNIVMADNIVLGHRK